MARRKRFTPPAASKTVAPKKAKDDLLREFEVAIESDEEADPSLNSVPNIYPQTDKYKNMTEEQLHTLEMEREARNPHRDNRTLNWDHERMKRLDKIVKSEKTLAARRRKKHYDRTVKELYRLAGEKEFDKERVAYNYDGFVEGIKGALRDAGLGRRVTGENQGRNKLTAVKDLEREQVAIRATFRYTPTRKLVSPDSFLSKEALKVFYELGVDKLFLKHDFYFKVGTYSETFVNLIIQTRLDSLNPQELVRYLLQGYLERDERLLSYITERAKPIVSYGQKKAFDLADKIANRELEAFERANILNSYFPGLDNTSFDDIEPVQLDTQDELFTKNALKKLRAAGEARHYKATSKEVIRVFGGKGELEDVAHTLTAVGGEALDVEGSALNRVGKTSSIRHFNRDYNNSEPLAAPEDENLKIAITDSLDEEAITKDEVYDYYIENEEFSDLFDAIESAKDDKDFKYMSKVEEDMVNMKDKPGPVSEEPDMSDLDDK